MASPGTLTSFSPNTLIKSADVNTNFSTLRNSLLTAGFIDTANTWALSQTFQSGMSVSGAATFSSGVTFTSGTTVTASGVTVAGGVTFSGAVVFSAVVTMSATLTAAKGSVVLTSTLTTVAFAVNTTQDTGLSGSAGVVNIVASATKITQATSNIWAIGPTVNAQTNNGGGLATNATVGYVCVPIGTSTQTGVPNVFAGNAGMIYDTVNNHLLIFNPSASAWKSATFA